MLIQERFVEEPWRISSAEAEACVSWPDCLACRCLFESEHFITCAVWRRRKGGGSEFEWRCEFVVMRNILLLSYAFPPDNTPAAIRPAQLFRYLPEHGFQPIVIASKGEGISNSEPYVHRVPAENVPIRVSMTSNIVRRITRVAAPYNDHWPWVPYAASAAADLITSKANRGSLLYIAVSGLTFRGIVAQMKVRPSLDSRFSGSQFATIHFVRGIGCIPTI